METSPVQETTTAPTGGSQSPVLRIVLGLLLMLPATLACGVSFLLPTIQTFLLSLQDTRRETFTGFQNYEWLFGSGTLPEMLGFNILLMIVRIMVVMIVPVIVALLVNEFGRKVRIPLRLLYTIPLALFVPIVSVIAWRNAVARGRGLFGNIEFFTLPAAPRRVVTLIDTLPLFGAAVGLGLILYLMALRGREDEPPTFKRVWLPLLATWLTGLLAVIGLTLQVFTPVYTLTGGNFRTSVFAIEYFQVLFMRLDFGRASAIANLLLFMLLPLGLLAGGLVVFSRLRIETVPPEKESAVFSRDEAQKSARMVVLILLIAAVLFTALVCLLAYLPFPWNLLQAFGERGLSRLGDAIRTPLITVWINTLFPTLIGVLILQLPLTYLAALGIGGLRPLGKWSELLLLPFSPWLFVTTLPLIGVYFRWLSTADLVDSFIALLPPLLISLPMLFILTLFFKGQEQKWEAAREAGDAGFGGFFKIMILPSLPITALLAFSGVLISMNNLPWALTVGIRPEHMTFPVLLMRTSGMYGADIELMAAALLGYGLPLFIVSFLVLGAFQVFYMDRLALTTGAGKPASVETAAGDEEETGDAEDSSPTEAPETEEEAEEETD